MVSRVPGRASRVRDAPPATASNRHNGDGNDNDDDDGWSSWTPSTTAASRTLSNVNRDRLANMGIAPPPSTSASTSTTSATSSSGLQDSSSSRNNASGSGQSHGHSRPTSTYSVPFPESHNGERDDVVRHEHRRYRDPDSTTESRQLHNEHGSRQDKDDDDERQRQRNRAEIKRRTFKTKQCRAYLEGRCPNHSSRCHFLHVDGADAAMVIAQRNATLPCPSLIVVGECTYGVGCLFKHVVVGAHRQQQPPLQPPVHRQDHYQVHQPVQNHVHARSATVATDDEQRLADIGGPRESAALSREVKATDQKDTYSAFVDDLIDLL